MGDTVYPPALFAEKVVCIERVIHAILFSAQRQLYLVTFNYDDVAEFHVNWISGYMPYSC